MSRLFTIWSKNKDKLREKNLTNGKRIATPDEPQKSRAVEDRLSDLEAQVARLKEENHNLVIQRGLAESSYQKLHTQYMENLDVLTHVQENMRSASAFLGTNDDFSGEDILRAMQDLNTDIMQLSANVADAIKFTSLTRLPLEDASQLNAYLNPAFTAALQERDFTEDSSLVQYALQACLTHYIGRLMSCFCFGLDHELDNFLEALFQVVQTSDTQAIAGRWRALSHRHGMGYLQRRSLAAIVTPSVINDFESILALAGSSRPLPPQYANQIQAIEATATKWSYILKENIVSKAYYVILPIPSDPFDPTTMSDIFDSTNPSRSPVACAFALGLGFSVKTRVPTEVEESVQIKTVLPAQVVQESSWQDLLDS